MSYDIKLTDPVSGEPLDLDEPHQMKGGTYAIGGTTELCLNVTYNYAVILYRVMPERYPRNDVERLERGLKDWEKVGGIRMIYGMTGAASIPALQSAIDQLGDETDPDYWMATEGNVKRALLQLQALARLRPDGVWTGD